MSTASNAFHSADRSVGRGSGGLPDLRFVHWLPRILLAGIIFHQGFMKLPLVATTAEGLGIPFVLYALAALGQLAAGVALVAGGLMRNVYGDVLTRLGGLAVALITFSVLVVVYSVFTMAPGVVWAANKVHLLLIAGGLYFMARGNAA